LDTDKGLIQAGLKKGIMQSTVFVLLLENDETWHVFDAAYNYNGTGLVKVLSLISKTLKCDIKKCAGWADLDQRACTGDSP